MTMALLTTMSTISAESTAESTLSPMSTAVSALSSVSSRAVVVGEVVASAGDAVPAGSTAGGTNILSDVVDGLLALCIVVHGGDPIGTETQTNQCGYAWLIL